MEVLYKNKDRFFTTKEMSEIIGISQLAIGVTLKGLRKSELIQWKEGSGNSYLYRYRELQE